MLGMLPTHAKKNWQEWVATLMHAYYCTVSPVIGFSPYFLMFGRTPRLPLDIELGNIYSQTKTNIPPKLCSETSFQVTMGISESSRE